MLVLVSVLSLLVPDAHANSILLGSADSYAVLAATTVTNVPTSATAVIGDMGIYTGTSCTGFAAAPPCTLPPGSGTVSGAINLFNVASMNATADSLTAYNALAATPAVNEGTDSLGSGGTPGSTLPSLAPGVYSFTGAVTDLLGTLTLAGDGNSNDLWIFEIATGFTTASDSSVVVNNTGEDAGVYFEVGSQATLGVDSTIQGNILAGTSIVLDPGAQITCGRAFAQTAAVNFHGVDTSNGMENEVDSSDCSAISSTGFNGGAIEAGIVVPTSVVTPEPGTLLLLGTGLLAVGLSVRRKVLVRLAGA
jgi:type VI secretion system secreted protein VgrG